MIEYKGIISKRIVLIIADLSDSSSSTLIPGVAALDEESYMFQIKPDKEVCEEYDEEECIGIGIEEFENDIILSLKPDHELRKKFKAEYMIVLR